MNIQELNKVSVNGTIHIEAPVRHQVMTSKQTLCGITNSAYVFNTMRNITCDECTRLAIHIRNQFQEQQAKTFAHLCERLKVDIIDDPDLIDNAKEYRPELDPDCDISFYFSNDEHDFFEGCQMISFSKFMGYPEIDDEI